MIREEMSWARSLGVCVAAGVFLALIGAFGTDGEPLPRRLAYWVGLLLAGGLIGGGVARAVFSSPTFADRPWVACASIAALMTPPLTLVVWAASVLFFRLGWDPVQIVRLLPPVGLVSTAVTAIAYVADRHAREPHNLTSAAADDAPVRFLERLPPKLRGARIYAVEAEDHYLRIHTDRGSDLILMRLADAVAELEGIEGARTHRSWWVAKDAVAGVERGDGRATLSLRNGLEAPVSRSYAPVLREAGWY